MIFDKRGKSLNNYLFRYGADELENVKSYKYRGLIMSPFGNFNLARQESKKVALKALSKLRKEMGSHFRENIKLTMKLFDALISPILFYVSARTKTNRRTDREQYTRSNAATARLLTLVKPAET